MPAPPNSLTRATAIYLTRANAPGRALSPDDSAAFAPARLAQGWRSMTAAAQGAAARRPGGAG